MSKINSELKALFINGAKVPVVDGSFTYDMGGRTRDPVLGSGQVLGAAEAIAPGTCSFDVAYFAGDDPTDFSDLTGAQIRVVFDNGAQWMLKRAFSTTPASGSAGSGTYSLAYAGDPWLVTKK